MNKLFLMMGLVAILVVSLILGGCAQPAPAPAPAPTPAPAPAPAPAPEEKWPDAISFAAGTPKSGAYVRTAGLSVLIDKYLGVSCAPESVGVPHAQLKAMQAGKVELVSPTDTTHESSIVCVRTPHVEESYDKLKQAGVVCVMREGAIRLSPHIYNTVEEIERVVEILGG